MNYPRRGGEGSISPPGQRGTTTTSSHAALTCASPHSTAARDTAASPSSRFPSVAQAEPCSVSGAVLHEVIHLPEWDSRIVLGIVQQFGEERDTSDVR